MTHSLETLAFGAPAAEVAQFVHRDGAVILRDVLTAQQLAQINAELDGPLRDTRQGSVKENVEYQNFHGYRTKRLTNTITLSKTAREDVHRQPDHAGLRDGTVQRRLRHVLAAVVADDRNSSGRKSAAACIATWTIIRCSGGMVPTMRPK